MIKYAKNVGENEENLCSTCMTPFLADSGYPKIRFQVPDPSLFFQFVNRSILHLERFLAAIEPLRILGLVTLLLLCKRTPIGMKFIAEGMKFISEYSMIFLKI